MISITGTFVCDAEIGSVRAGWHGCGKKAVCESYSQGPGMYLHWCETHRKRATSEGRRFTRELSTSKETS